MSVIRIAHIVHRLQVDYQRIVVQFPVQAKDFFSPQRFQAGSAAHPATYVMGVRGLFPGEQRGYSVIQHELQF